MRDEITYSIRDEKILENASSIFMIELLIYSYKIGTGAIIPKLSTEAGVIFFLVSVLLVSAWRFSSNIVLFLFTIQSTKYLYHKLEKMYDSNMLLVYIFTALGVVFIYGLHKNTFFYYHEPEYEYDED